jgi:hypothetical protein
MNPYFSVYFIFRPRVTGLGSVRLIKPPTRLQGMTYSRPSVTANLVQPEANPVCEI